MSDMSQLQSVVHALGWTLIHFLWQGLAVAGAYWLLCRLTPQRNAAFRYWSGMLAFLAAVTVPVATFMYYWPSSRILGGVEVFVTPLAPVAGNMGATVGQAISIALEPTIPVVVALWALGVSFLSLRAGMGWIGALRLVRLDTRAVHGVLSERFEQLKRQVGVSRAVRMLESARVQVPTVVGWIRPVILLPVAVLSRLPREQLEMVLAHELGHIRRYDYLFNLLQLVVETLFFYHPAIRWMSNQVRQEREHCCDDLVVAACGQPVLYARALANLEVLRDPLPVVALAASGGDLLHRVRRIIQGEVPGRQGGFSQLLTMMAVAVLVGTATVQGLEMRLRVLDSMETRPDWQAVSMYQGAAGRRGWVEGTRGFSVASLVAGAARAEHPAARSQSSGLDRENEPRVTTSTVADRHSGSKLPANAGQHATGVNASVEKPLSGESLFALPGPEAVSREEIMLLASIARPDAARLGARSPVGALLEDSEPSFEIEAETTVAPVYPFKARRKRIDGHVKLEFSVNRKGRAEDIRVVEARPADTFEKAAIAALEKWRFKVDDGYAGSQRLYQSFDFGMEEIGEILPKRERRCDITGSRICGLQRYNDKN